MEALCGEQKIGKLEFEDLFWERLVEREKSTKEPIQRNKLKFFGQPNSRAAQPLCELYV